LIFIEGVAKGNQLIKIESIKGLAKLGIQNFRALILGLRDDDAVVRQTAIEVILDSFTP
jgi:HEAT repeat protein